jgi:uncharacterized protein (TIGR03435 family)
MSVIPRAIPAILAAVSAFSQTPAQPARLEFEVASIKPSAVLASDQVNVGVHIDGAMVIIHSFSLKDYIALAYQVKDLQVSGPDWLGNLKFDINAKIPDGALRSQLPGMLQVLLEDRFKLTLHRDKRDFPIYALTLAKGGPKFKESAPDSEADSDKSGADKSNINVSVTGGGRGGAVVNLGRGSYISNSGGKVEAHKVTIAALLDSAVTRFFDRPVVDMTGLTGTYDITLTYGVEDLRLMLRNVGVDQQIPDYALPPGSIVESMRSVGLVIEARKAPLDILVIDHVEKTPVAN